MDILSSHWNTNPKATVSTVWVRKPQFKSIADVTKVRLPVKLGFQFAQELLRILGFPQKMVTRNAWDSLTAQLSCVCHPGPPYLAGLLYSEQF